jgi:ADP-ribose pyrophosphatase YjhB (NUDIX family)
MEMMPDLTSFLAGSTPQAREDAIWGAGTMPLQIAAYVESRQPPLPYVTSVRGLVFRTESLLVLRNADGTHILPGGRREPGETLEDTLLREVLEETGWTIRSLHPLGFLHFHHLAPKPEGYSFPHPDFIQVVCMAQAAVYQPEARLPDDNEIEARFLRIGEVHSLSLSAGERLYLATALEHRRKGCDRQ